MDYRTAVYSTKKMEVDECLDNGDFKKALDIYQILYDNDSTFGEMILKDLMAIIEKYNKDIPDKLKTKFGELISQITHKPSENANNGGGFLSVSISVMGWLLVLFAIISLFLPLHDHSIDTAHSFAVFIVLLVWGFLVVGFGSLLKYVREIRYHFLNDDKNAPN